MFNRPITFLIAINALALFGGGIVAFERLPKAEPAPAFRHTLEYDKCLARGRTVMACDAEARVRAAELDDLKRRDPFYFYGEVAPVEPAQASTDWRQAISDYASHPTYELPSVDGKRQKECLANSGIPDHPVAKEACAAHQ